MMCFLVLVLIGVSTGQSHTVVRGNIRDENGQPLPYINVFLRGTFDGCISEENGDFTFLPRSRGSFELTASCVGYKPFLQKIIIEEGKTLTLRIVLENAEVHTNEVVVSASSFSSESGKGLVLSAQDIYMTPGGAADIFQSLKTMPGMTLVSESAELYIRGGDPTESITMIDKAPMYHPYTFESSYGGLFSSLNTSAIQDMYFSSGGFSARYGNALSGVLDLKTKSDAAGPALQLGLSIANAQVSTETQLFDKSISFHFDARSNLPRPLFAINGGLDRFAQLPVSQDGDILLNYKYSQSGLVKVTIIRAGDHEGVNVDLPEYSGVFDNHSTNTLLNIYHSDRIFENVVLSSSISTNRYDRTWTLGVLDVTTCEDVRTLRSDVSVILMHDITVQTGFEMEYRKTAVDGIIPQENYDQMDNAPMQELSEKYNSTRYGIYAEMELPHVFNVSSLSAQLGMRTDFVPAISQQWFDPRLTVGYKASDRLTLRLSTGVFHQLFDIRSMSDAWGTSAIKPMEAKHLVLGSDLVLDQKSNVRCEIFSKWYSHLPHQIVAGEYNNDGYGYAYGVDFVAKGNLTEKFSGWISYEYLNSKRNWMDFQSLAPSNYDVTHNLTLIINYQLTQSWDIGTSARFATGTPFTPVVSSIYHKDLDVYEPVYGAVNSDRLQTYQRVDLRITHLTQLFDKYFTVVYLEGLNILNLENIFDYTYSRDYSDRRTIPSYFGKRTIVVGGMINL